MQSRDSPSRHQVAAAPPSPGAAWLSPHAEQQRQPAAQQQHGPAPMPAPGAAPPDAAVSGGYGTAWPATDSARPAAAPPSGLVAPHSAGSTAPSPRDADWPAHDSSAEQLAPGEAPPKPATVPDAVADAWAAAGTASAPAASSADTWVSGLQAAAPEPGSVAFTAPARTATAAASGRAPAHAAADAAAQTGSSVWSSWHQQEPDAGCDCCGRRHRHHHLERFGMTIACTH